MEFKTVEVEHVVSRPWPPVHSITIINMINAKAWATSPPKTKARHEALQPRRHTLPPPPPHRRHGRSARVPVRVSNRLELQKQLQDVFSVRSRRVFEKNPLIAIPMRLGGYETAVVDYESARCFRKCCFVCKLFVCKASAMFETHYNPGVRTCIVSRHHAPLISSATCVATLEGHSSYVSPVAFHSTATLVATGSWDKTAKLWQLRSMQIFSCP